MVFGYIKEKQQDKIKEKTYPVKRYAEVLMT